MSGWIVRENPARVTEEAGRVPVSDAAEVDAAVRAVKAAQPGWAALPVAERAAALAAAADALERACPAGSLARETGKPLADCRGELRFAAAYLRWAAEHAPPVFADREVDDTAGRMLLRRRPYGVVAAITPWNAPVILAMVKVGAALAAGNAVVVKPSPLAPLTVASVLGLFADDVPVRVVQGGADTGRTLVGHPEVGRVTFTGGGAAARDIGATAARSLTPAVLELGGNDAAVFLDDADLSDEAMDRLVMASFATAGQVCMAAKRLYVPRRMLGDFREAYLAAAHRTLVLGDPLAAGTTVGPVVSAEAASRVRALVADAAARGADVTELGVVRAATEDGYFVRPTLLTGLDDDAPAVAQEQFGPTVPLLIYDTEDEALARANAGELGLGASVWSADEDRAFAFARRFEAGFTFVNTHNRTGMALRAPFGGVKRSGHGREYGVEGLLEYAQTCVVHAPAAFRAGGGGMAASGYPS